MSNLLGGGAGQPVATQATRYNGMQVQASQYGMGLPIVYGQTRIAGTLIWYGDFQAIEHTQSVGKGGGNTSTSYTYSSSFQLALCEGPIASIATIWKDSGTTTLGDINGAYSLGTASQAAWSHLSGSAALQYPYTVWVGCLNLALGSSPTVPNLNFEIGGLFQYGSGIVDADPSVIFSDLLTSTTHGIGFQYLGDLTTYHDYCVANNIFLSLKVDQETTMNEVLTRLLQITNSNTAWSNGKLIVIPYGDQSATANGVTYTPPTTVVASLADADFIKGVQITRKPLSDLYNVVRLEWLNRSNNYNTTVAEAKDQGDIDQTFALRQQQMIQAHAITNGTLAQWTAQQILQRALYIRNTYQFTTTMEYVTLEPGDVIELSDSQADLVNEPVRIVSISEQAGNELQITCEEFPAGVATGATQSVEAPAGYVPTPNAAPDATQPAVIFRAPQYLNNGIPEVWIGVGGAGTNWGGANVLLSLDNVSYQKIGTIAPGCRYGTLTAALADSTAFTLVSDTGAILTDDAGNQLGRSAATDPDTTDSFSVALDAGGTLSGGTSADADNLATLMLVDQELIAYSSTTLNGDGTYTLGTYIRRGCYGTTIAAHSIGAPWLRVDNTFFRYQIDPSLVGSTVYIKIQPWNLYGGGLVSESSITPISYVVGTAEEIPDTPPTPTGLTAFGATDGNHLSWTVPNPAAVAITSVEYSPDNTTWTVLGQTQGTHYVHGYTGAATYYYRVRSRSPAVIWSAYTSSVASFPGGRAALATGFDGTNVVENPEFIGGSSAGWSLSGGAAVLGAASAPASCPTAYCLQIPTQNGNAHTDCYAGTAAQSYMRVHPGQQVRLSLMYATDSTFNGSVGAGVEWLEGDGVTAISWTHHAPSMNTASQAWTAIEWYETAPTNAVYARPWLTNFGVASGAAGAWYATLFRAGGMTGPADTTKGDIATTGTIPPGASTVAISYSSTTTSIEVLWSAGTIYRMDGSSVAVTSGNQTVTGLTAGTLYNFGVYYDEIAGTMKLLTGGSGAVGSPLAAYTSQAAVNTAAIYGQTHAPFGWYQFATPASGTGGGGGSGGCCLHGEQTIELADGSLIEARKLNAGDLLTSPTGSTPIVQLRIEPWREWYIIGFNDGTSHTVAGDHRYIDPAGDQIHARDLKLQQIVDSKRGPVAVTSLDWLWESADKVSIEVAAPHVYYVHGILAHNKVLC